MGEFNIFEWGIFLTTFAQERLLGTLSTNDHVWDKIC